MTSDGRLRAAPDLIARRGAVLPSVLQVRNLNPRCDGGDGKPGDQHDASKHPSTQQEDRLLDFRPSCSTCAAIACCRPINRIQNQAGSVTMTNQ